ncbi:MAG TPA: DUF4013 domain-containing protein [Candidatus Dormibacteraeota bacterium]|nr:DUF4013 domain-containing protein [Candidatus Dormibacteraeota bacterium]
MDRIADAFAWPSRDPEWLTKLLIIALTLFIPFVGALNGLGWMLATLDRLRAGEERLAPANLGYIGRGFRLFVVNLVYALAITLLTGLIYVPAIAVASNQSHGSANPAMVSLAILLSVLAFSIATLGSLALNFASPSIVLATDGGGIAAGLNVSAVLRRARSNLANTLIAGLMLIAAGFIGSLGLVACGIGVLFTTAYALAMQAWIIRSFEVGSPAVKAA